MNEFNVRSRWLGVSENFIFEYMPSIQKIHLRQRMPFSNFKQLNHRLFSLVKLHPDKIYTLPEIFIQHHPEIEEQLTNLQNLIFLPPTPNKEIVYLRFRAPYCPERRDELYVNFLHKFPHLKTINAYCLNRAIHYFNYLNDLSLEVTPDCRLSDISCCKNLERLSISFDPYSGGSFLCFFGHALVVLNSLKTLSLNVSSRYACVNCSSCMFQSFQHVKTLKLMSMCDSLALLINEVFYYQTNLKLLEIESLYSDTPFFSPQYSWKVMRKLKVIRLKGYSIGRYYDDKWYQFSWKLKSIKHFVVHKTKRSDYDEVIKLFGNKLKLI